MMQRALQRPIIKKPTVQISKNSKPDIQSNVHLVENQGKQRKKKEKKKKRKENAYRHACSSLNKT